jgi:hypothetical protein
MYYSDPDMPDAVVDKRDIGRYIALVIEDERTLNQKVFAYGEVITQRKAVELMERLSGRGFGPGSVSYMK